MAVLNVSPTRMELTKIKKQLEVAAKGHRLLKDKRDELMRQFLSRVKETRELRQQVEQAIAQANNGFALASAVMQPKALMSALLFPGQSTTIQITRKSIMGVDVPVFETQQNETSDALPYGFAFTSGELDQSIRLLSNVLPDLLALAQQEKTLQLLASEIEKTRRRVNALEHVMIPNYRDTVRYITMKLDETERSNLTRLMKVKDMMAAK